MYIVFRGIDERITRCEYHTMGSGDSFAEFMKAEVCLCAVVVALVLLAQGFSIYSLLHPRYTYKRVAASLHLMTAITLLILMEMVKSETHLSQHDIDGASVLKHSTVYFGFSYLLSWVVFILFLMASVAFFIGSRKRKRLPFDFETSLK